MAFDGAFAGDEEDKQVSVHSLTVIVTANVFKY